jgi:trimethylamine monooxygenase
MHADIDKWRGEEDNLPDDYACIAFQGKYTMDLMSQTDYPHFDCAGSNEAFFQWKTHKKEDIMTFRNHGYKSALTGTQAPAHHTLWRDALDDSLEAYLRTES